MASKKFTQEEKNKAKEYLLESIQPGDTVYTILRHVSQSGMLRVIDLFIVKDNQPYRVSWNAGIVIGSTYDRNKEGLRVSGCGMDMGFDLVYRLASVLFGDGYKLDHRWL